MLVFGRVESILRVWEKAFGKLTQCPVGAISFFMEFMWRLSQRKREKGVLMFLRILYFLSQFYTSLPPPSCLSLSPPSSPPSVLESCCVGTWKCPCGGEGSHLLPSLHFTDGEIETQRGQMPGVPGVPSSSKLLFFQLLKVAL